MQSGLDLLSYEVPIADKKRRRKQTQGFLRFPVRLQNRVSMYGAVIRIVLYKCVADSGNRSLGDTCPPCDLFTCCLESAGSDFSVLC